MMILRDRPFRSLIAGPLGISYFIYSLGVQEFLRGWWGKKSGFCVYEDVATKQSDWL